MYNEILPAGFSSNNLQFLLEVPQSEIDFYQIFAEIFKFKKGNLSTIKQLSLRNYINNYTFLNDGPVKGNGKDLKLGKKNLKKAAGCTLYSVHHLG